MIGRLFKNALLIYQKVIIIFLVLLAPVYLLSVWANKMSADYIKDEILNSSRTKVSYYF